MKTVLLGFTALIIAMSTQGCAALVAGYIVGDAMSKSEKRAQCRANLKLQNDLRLQENKDPFPDMC